jgi:hypothetical protein
MGEKRNYMQDFGGKPEGKRPLGRLRYGWQNNINMDHGEIDLGSMNCIYLVQDRNQWRALVKTVMNIWFL